MSDELNPYAAPTTTQRELVNPHEYYGGQLRWTARGLRLMYWGILLTLVVWIVFIPLGFFGVGFGLYFVLMLPMLGMLAVFCGPLLCLTVPAESGLRPWIIATVTCQLSTVAGLILMEVAGVSERFSSAFGFLLLALTYGLFLYFLCQLTRCIERPDLTRRTKNVGILAAVAVLSTLGSVGAGGLGWVGASLLAVVFLLYLLLFVASANLINSISHGIRQPSQAVSSAII